MMPPMNAMRVGRVVLALAVLLLAIGGPAVMLVPALANATAPSQTPNQIDCAPPFERGAGGQTIAAGKFLVDLPAGYNFIWNAPPSTASSGTLRICVIEYFSQININAATGEEISRIVAIASAGPVLDFIADSARLATPPTPTPAPPPPAAAGSGSSTSQFGTIRPPNTGDGGVR